MRLFLAFISAFTLAFTATIQTASAEEDKPPSYGNKLSKKYFKNRFRRKRDKTIRALSFSEYGVEKPDYKTFKNKINHIKDREIIRLDITLKNTQNHFPEGTPCKGSEWGSLDTTATTTIHLLPIAGNINMIFEILPGTREKFPFTSVSCVYNPTTPQKTYVRFTGFFVVHHHIVPSAVLHEFRAIARPSHLR